MRYRELIPEAIVNRPHHLGTYVRNRIRDLEAILVSLKQAEKLIIAHQDGERLVSQCMRYSGHDDAYAYVDWFAGLAEYRRLDRYFHLEQLLEAMRSWLAHGPTFLRYVISSFRYTDPFDDRFRAVMQAIPDLPKGFAEYGYEPGKDYSDDDDYVQALGYVEGLNLLTLVVQKAEAVTTDIRRKVGEVEKISGYGDRYRPDHGETEELYHATAFCTEILRDGFVAEPPEGRRGLGNLGTQKEISFTHSLEIAHTLARCLKEMWMIAHGQLTGRQIVSWIRKEGIEDKRVEQSVGLGVSLPAIKGFEDDLRHRIKTLDEIARDNDKVETAKLYRVYLSFTKLRNDPVFTYPEETMEMMKTRDIKDIGVLKCAVRLTPEDEYKVGESEFRVMADRVQSVKRVY